MDTVYQLGLLLVGACLFSHWLNYCMGSPYAEERDIDPSAILYKIPLALANAALHRHELLTEFLLTLDQQLTVAGTDAAVRRDLRRDNHKARLIKARSLFTWERSLLCPVCLHFWLTAAIMGLAYGLHLVPNVAPLFLIYLLLFYVTIKI